VHSSTPTSGLKTTFATIAISAGLLLCPVAAEAYSPVPPKSAEPQIQSIEAAILGPEHAAEHAQGRADMRREIHRWRTMSPARRHRVRLKQRRTNRLLARASVAAGTPDQVGEWTTAPFNLPAYGIHSVVLPTGKVLMWSFPFYPSTDNFNEGRAFLWDPTKGTGADSFKEVDPPVVDLYGDGTHMVPAPIFCSAQSFLPNGDVLVSGGTLAFPNTPTYNPTPNFLGLDQLYTFNPWTESWVRQPNLSQGRWYASQVELADGRTVIMAGTNQNNQNNQDLEVFTPSPDPAGVGTLVNHSGDGISEFYPHLFSLLSGNVLLAGPGVNDSAILNTGSFTWSNLNHPSGWRWAGNAVLLPEGPSGSDTVMQLGGTGTNPNDTADNKYGVATTETIDASQPNPSWHTDSSQLNVPRAHANTVLLPDGSMVVVGGGQGQSTALGNFATLPGGVERQVELYDPQTKTWQLGPAQQEDRTYHSTAVLLPDGRVLSAGDNYHPGDALPVHYDTSDTGEIYSPPYLFKGPRPTITAAPDAVHWADQFGVATPDQIKSAVLMEPSATTHADDMSQREVPLQVVNQVPGQGVNLTAPPTSGVAPPGYYMLFLLNAQGVPSVASWIRLDQTAPDQPSITPTPTTTPSPASDSSSTPPPAAVLSGKKKCTKKHHGHCNKKSKVRR
jgi:hypothetical protein